MRIGNFVRIVLIAAALTAYTAWARNPASPRLTLSGDTVPTPDGIPLVDLSEAEALWQQPTTLFLDVRTASDYAVGHIEGAMHLSYETFAERLPELKPRLQRAGALVVYCKSVDCGKSLWAAIALRNAGLTQVVIYPNGWHEWVLAGKPSFKAER